MSDAQVTQLSEKMDKQFLKMFKYMQENFTDIRKELDKKASAEQFNQIMDALDAFAKQHVIDSDERAATNNQLNRHDAWLHQLAQKTKTTLSYE